MMDILYSIGSFLVAISILIAFHEFGHYWVAKRLGVKVLRYSIGFGKPLWKKTAGPDNTEYVIAALPLGGYVKMLDEREGEVAEAEKHRAFNRQKIWKRFAIVFAGPAFNLLFAVLAYLFVALIGSSGVKPVIALVEPKSPAAVAGLQAGMEIISVEGWRTPTWNAVLQEALPRLVDRTQVQVNARIQNGIEHTYTLNLHGLGVEEGLQQPEKAMGIFLFNIPATVGGFGDGETPAKKAGLQVGDVITQINDHPILHWTDISDYVVARPDQDLTVTVNRKGEVKVFKIHTAMVKVNGQKVGRLGIAPDTSSIKISDADRTELKLGLLDGVVYAVHRTWVISDVTLRALWLIASTKMSLTNISGPISIAVTAGQSASMGINQFVIFLALVSVSLGILNLLPIPILDGGHLMFYVYEFFSGKPVSEQVEAIGQRIGIALLMMLMALAFYNDIMRYVH